MAPKTKSENKVLVDQKKNKPKNTDKTDKTDKKDKKQDQDEGPNKATTTAGLMFNVNTFRNWMKGQFDVKEDSMPKFNGVHVALTAAVEEMVKLLIQAALSHLPKDKAQLYELGKGSLSYVVQIDSDFKKIFMNHLEKFDDNENYTSNYIVSKDTFTKFIDKHFGKNIKLNNEGHNLLVYLLNKFAVTLTMFSKNLLDYAEKKSLKPRTMLYAVKLLCNESMSNVICMRIEDSCKLAEDDEEDTNKPKEKKKSKDQKEDKEDDEVSDDDDDDDEASESESESESENESDNEQDNKKNKKKTSSK